MNLKSSLGLVVLLCCLTSSTFAFVFTRADQSPDFVEPWNPPYPPASIALEATASYGGDAIGLGTESTDPAIPVGGRIVLSLTGGATFADALYSLESWQGGAGNGNNTYATLITATPAGSSSIEFSMGEQTNPPPGFGTPPDSLADVPIFLLSGNSTSGQPINVNLPQVAGRDISIQAEIFDASNVSLGTASLVLFASSLEAPAAPLPATSQLGQWILLIMFGLIGAHAIRRRRIQPAA